MSCCPCGRTCQSNAMLSNSSITNVDHLQTVSILPWQRGMAEIICLNVFIYNQKCFISHCEKCDQRLPALVIIHLNLPGTELVSTLTPPATPPSFGKRCVSTLLSPCEVLIVRVLQMYPQGTGRGSVTATL